MIESAARNTAFIVVAVVSLTASLLVFGTFLRFPEMQKKLFFKCIQMSSMANAGLEIVSLFGFLHHQSALCWIQGLAAVYFPLVSWFWITLLYYCVYCVVQYERLEINIWFWYFFCWGFPLVLCLIPLTTNDYGVSSRQAEWCLISSREGTSFDRKYFWRVLAFVGWFALCILLMLYWSLRMFSRMIWQSSTHTATVMHIYGKLWIYPFSMLLFWSLHNLTLAIAPLQSSALIEFLGTILGLANGLGLSLIFFLKSEEARTRWRHALFGHQPSSRAVNLASARESVAHQQQDQEIPGSPNLTETANAGKRSSIGKFSMFSGNSYSITSRATNNVPAPNSLDDFAELDHSSFSSNRRQPTTINFIARMSETFTISLRKSEFVGSDRTLIRESEAEISQSVPRTHSTQGSPMVVSSTGDTVVVENTNNVLLQNHSSREASSSLTEHPSFDSQLDDSRL